MNESEICDLLVDQLDCLETDLQYLEKDLYIPSKIATRSFIDLLARDSKGHIVIIELKRSDSAAREAIHEILKYVEAAKHHLALRDDEIRTLIVSTEWRELLLPFSRFCSETALDVTGFALDISNPSKLESQIVSHVPITIGRVFSPWHELSLYANRESLSRGVKSYEQVNHVKSLENHVLVILEAPSSHREIEQSVLRANLVEGARMFQSEPDFDEIESKVQALPEYKYMIYFVSDLKSKEFCIDALRRSGDVGTEEIIEYAEQLEEDEALRELHNAMYDASPTPYREYLEIGYPSKFNSKLLEDEGWSIVEIKRYGAIARNPLLTEKTIVSEICGATGRSHQYYNRCVSTEVRSELATARFEIEECLSDNPTWSANILGHLSEIEEHYPNSELDIQIFSPATGLYTLFLSLMNSPGDQYIPSYHINVRNHDETETIFFGVFSVDPTEATFQQVMDEFYDGNTGNLVVYATSGFREIRDAEVLSYLGIDYASYRYDVRNGEQRSFVWHNSTWQGIDAPPPFRPLDDFFATEHTFTLQLLANIGRHHRHGYSVGYNIDDSLQELSDQSYRNSTRHKTSELSSHCDLCGCDFSEEYILVQASLREIDNVTTSFCSDCFADETHTLDEIYGSLYRRVNPDTWVLVFSADSDATEK